MIGWLAFFSVSRASHPASSFGSLPGVTLRVASMPKPYLISVKRLHISSVCLTKPIIKLFSARMNRLSVLAQT